MRIKGVEFEQAPPAVKETYRRLEQLLGRVPSPTRVMAHVPPLLDAANNLGATISGSTLVEPRLKTMVSLRAAQMAGCPF
jgi:alkylhydroperoxidase family enzyme